MTDERAMAIAREHGGKPAWKSKMPLAPESLAGASGGEWRIKKIAGRRTLVYRLEGKDHVIGELDEPAGLRQAQAAGLRQAQPAGLRQAQPAEGWVESTLTAPAPLILIEPGAEGTRFNEYGLELPEVIEELRRALVHLVATSAGVEVISVTVPRDAAVVFNGRFAGEQVNGLGGRERMEEREERPRRRNVRTTVRYPVGEGDAGEEAW